MFGHKFVIIPSLEVFSITIKSGALGHRARARPSMFRPMTVWEVFMPESCKW